MANRNKKTRDYAVVACEAREALGMQALAVELGVTVDRTRALVFADWKAIDDAVYAETLDRGDAILAELARMTIACGPGFPLPGPKSKQPQNENGASPGAAAVTV